MKNSKKNHSEGRCRLHLPNRISTVFYLNLSCRSGCLTHFPENETSLEKAARTLLVHGRLGICHRRAPNE
jgi:hypothetical protein